MPETPPAVAFLSSRQAWFDPNGQQVFFDQANGRLLAYLSQQLPHLTIAAYAATQQGQHHELALQPARLWPMPNALGYGPALKKALTFIRQIKRLQKQHQVLVVQLPYHAFWVLWFIRKPVVYHICANVLRGANDRHKYKGWRRHLARFWATMLHKSYNYAFGHKQVRVITNGTELAQMYPKAQPTAVVSATTYAHELPAQNPTQAQHSQPNLLFVGRPSLEKGFDLLITALGLLVPQHPGLKLHIAGATWQELLSLLPGMQEAVQGLKEHIVCHGFVKPGPALNALLDHATCMAVPSRHEGTPRVVPEAFARGCPVVASRVGGLPDTIKQGLTGFLVSLENPQALANAMGQLLNSHELRQHLSQQAWQAAQHYTVEKFGATFVAQIQTLLTASK